MKNLPDTTTASMSQVLRGLPFGSKVLVSIQVPNQQKELERLKTQRRIAFSMARGKTEGASDIESESKYQSLETLLEEMVAEGEKIFKVAINIVLRSKNLDELDQQVSESLMTLRQLGGTEFIEETVASFEIFSEVCLPNVRAREGL